MPKVKITSDIEDMILHMLGAGISYEKIVERIEQERGVRLSVMAISHLKAKIKKSITRDAWTEMHAEQGVELDIKKASLDRCLGIALELCERHLKRLKDKDDEQGILESKDIRLLNEIIDRLIRLRSILVAQITTSGELEFPMEALREKYNIKTQKI